MVRCGDKDPVSPETGDDGDDLIFGNIFLCHAIVAPDDVFALSESEHAVYDIFVLLEIDSNVIPFQRFDCRDEQYRILAVAHHRVHTATIKDGGILSFQSKGFLEIAIVYQVHFFRMLNDFQNESGKGSE